MATSDANAEAIAARLTSLGLSPRLEQHARHVSIEAEVPDSLPVEAWQESLEAVAEADRFGLLANSLNGRTLWAAVRKGTPATGDVRGSDHQR
ncbi:hypothetical protein OG746_13135 [Streptomyces sp. NBC_01016]|uniref:hypothetical protein n=1 Tax=Streptomyces sp. NBC_01016 TaxID=2903720 RepID=UPI00225BC71A|nr:hypothetical protein [Streptomyces sp. NBC_01016]MCX4829674.1 hypothetical protein [Streptomyces sp. NBC_01016]